MGSTREVEAQLNSRSALTLRHSNGAETATLREQILPVYAASRADQLHIAWYSPEQFWDRLVGIHAKTRDFDLVTGWIDDVVVGYAFGSPRDTDDLWGDILGVYPDMTPSGDVYVFREFAVSPTWQRHGFGARIHDELLHHRPEQAAYLLVRPDNAAAQAAYSSWGWKQIGQIKPFPELPTFDALALDLRAFRIAGAG
jgi:ribosomal protein S18 acetylase RimI-like enzyme